MKSGYKTYLTGHSLGGAFAAILTIYMIEDGVEVVRVVTFGQPRFTTADGVKRLSFLPLARVVDENDIIRMVPPATAIDVRFGPYEHVGPEVILLEGRDIVYLPSHDANAFHPRSPSACGRLVGRPITRKERTLAKFTSSADDIALRSHRASRPIVPLLKQPCY